MRLRRHCYNKMWRCPCWSGGGWRSVNRPRKCKCGGSLNINWEPRWKAFWSFHRCRDYPACDVLVIPHITQWIDPSYLWFMVTMKWRDWRYERMLRRQDYR